jgi:hypothetical protein
MNPIKISVFNLVGDKFCVETKDGDAVFNSINKALLLKQPVEISFQNVEVLTPAFLNHAIGQLYDGFFSEEVIRDLVKVIDIEEVDRALLRRVIETAKFYYSKDRLSQAQKRILAKLMVNKGVFMHFTHRDMQSLQALLYKGYLKMNISHYDQSTMRKYPIVLIYLNERTYAFLSCKYPDDKKDIERLGRK